MPWSLRTVRPGGADAQGLCTRKARSLVKVGWPTKLGEGVQTCAGAPSGRKNHGKTVLCSREHLRTALAQVLPWMRRQSRRDWIEPLSSRFCAKPNIGANDPSVL